MKYKLLLIFSILTTNILFSQLINDFKVNEDTAGNVFKYHANISTNKSGLSAIVWEEYVLGNIYAQIFNNNFIRINNNFKVNEEPGICLDPDLIVTNGDKIAIVWEEVESAHGKIFFKLFNKFGLPLTTAIQLIDTLNGFGNHPHIRCDSSGRFIIAWDYNNEKVFFQILDSVGNKIGNNIKVNPDTTSYGSNILVKKDGSFVIIWSTNGSTVYLQMYNKNGIPIGAREMVNDSIGGNIHCSNLEIEQDSSGNFVVSFNREDFSANYNLVLYQRFDKNGVKIGNNKYASQFGGELFLSSFDSDVQGNLVFQLDFPNALYYRILNIRIDKNDNFIGTYFPVSNQYIESGRTGEDVKLYNNKIINVWRDIRLTPQPQIYANVRSYSNPDSTVGIINTSNEIPSKFKLYQNYPNPFNPVTKIKYELPKDGYVKLAIYDILGHEIKYLVNGFKKAGNYIVELNGNNLASGVYFYKIQSGNFIEVKKMVLLK